MTWADLIQVVLMLGGSAVLIQLLTLKQSRRKIAGDASTQEANAASLLSQAALQMVESERKDKQALRDEITSLRKDLDNERDKVDDLERYNGAIIRLLVHNDIPVPGMEEARR